MSDEAKPIEPAKHMEGVFIDAAGVEIGRFAGMVYDNHVRLDARGKGGYTPPVAKEGQTVDDDSLVVRFVVADKIDIKVRRARMQGGIISFLAWH